MRNILRSKLVLLQGICGLLLLPLLVKGQQTLQFSQYVFNMLSVNPAYAGYKEDLYLNATYRQQWVNFPGAPRTGSVSLDGVIKSKEERVGLGLQVMYDKLGPEDATSFYGMYSYRIPLDEDGTRRLCFGIGAGFTQYSLDGTAFQYTDAGDLGIPAAKVSTFSPDARFGIYYYTPKFYISAAVMDLFTMYIDPAKYYWKGYQYNTIRKTQHLYVTAGTVIDLSENFKLKPSILVKEDFKGPTNVDLNAFLLIADKGVRLWNKPHLPSGLDPLDAVSILAEFNINERFRIGYSYDLTINKMASSQSGSHEISLGITFPGKRSRVLSPRYF
jgi:type IX secretion system PorP/SprF family membrane protein